MSFYPNNWYKQINAFVQTIIFYKSVSFYPNNWYRQINAFVQTMGSNKPMILSQTMILNKNYGFNMFNVLNILHNWKMVNPQ